METFGRTELRGLESEGVIGMTRTWARELGKHNIRVNAVAPGFIATDMLKSMPPDILADMVSHTLGVALALRRTLPTRISGWPQIKRALYMGRFCLLTVA